MIIVHKRFIRATFSMIILGLLCPAGYADIPECQRSGIECCMQACARLAPHVTFLATQKIQITPLLLPSFSDPRITACIEQIEREGTGAPLRDLWGICDTTCLVHEHFVREFSLLVFVLYDTLIRSAPQARLPAPFPQRCSGRAVAGMCLGLEGVSEGRMSGDKVNGSSVTRTTIPWVGLVSLMMQLNKIPVSKLFDVLDECLKFYTDIITEYTNWNTRVSFEAWFAEYWWLPTCLAIMTIASFIRWRQAHAAQRFV